MLAVLIVSVAITLLLLVSIVYWLVMRMKRGNEDENRMNNLFSDTSTSKYHQESREFDESTRNSDLPYFNLNIIAATIDNFSDANKLGEGGFGLVYKVASLLEKVPKFE
jgi:hypothetical protein